MGKVCFKILFIVTTFLGGNSYATPEGVEFEEQMLNDEMQAFQKALETPKTFTTGIRSGRVVDATTGKPIEGAVVFYDWDITEFSMESNS